MREQMLADRGRRLVNFRMNIPVAKRCSLWHRQVFRKGCASCAFRFSHIPPRAGRVTEESQVRKPFWQTPIHGQRSVWPPRRRNIAHRGGFGIWLSCRSSPGRCWDCPGALGFSARRTPRSAATAGGSSNGSWTRAFHVRKCLRALFYRK